MKDELPDLTPYLNKKGGNSQGRGEENPPGKADISQKLSALVKKPGTNSGSHPSLPAAMAPQYMQEPNPSPQPSESASAQSLSSTPAAPAPAHPPQPIAPSASPPVPEFSPEAESSIGLTKRPSPSEADAPTVSDNIGLSPKSGSNGQSKATGWGALGNFPDDYDDPAPSPTTPQVVPEATAPAATASSPPISLPTAGPGTSQTNLQPSPGGSASPSREMPKPVQAVALDKLKMPQAKPMSTLSSSSAPSLLKTPSKQPGRPAQPYSYKPVIEPGREAMAPKAPAPAVNNKAPHPLPAKPATTAPAVSPLATPTQPQYQGSSPSSSSSSSSSSSNFSSSQSQTPAPAAPAPAPAPANKPFRVETDAEKLARAFQEEAQALQASNSQAGLGASFASAPISFDDTDAMDENIDESILNNSFFEDEGPVNAQPFQARVESPPLGDEYRPAYHYEEELAPEAGPSVFPEARAAAPEAGPKASLSNLFDSGVLNSRYGQEAPKKPLGFGNLLAGSGPAPTDDSHTAFADLMVPTGEHDALLAPDRHQDSGPSAFDEISAQLDADANFADHAPGENGNAFDLTESYNSEPDNAAGTAFRADEKAQPPAFSSLFSNEIVTSGQDFSNKWLSPEPTGLAPESNLDSDLLEPEASPYAAADNSSDSSLQGYLSDFQAEAVSGTGDTEVETVEESYNQSPKSLAISKLLEAVNQKDEPASSLFSSEIVGASSDAAVIDQSESATPAESHPPVTAKVEEDQATLESWLAENIGGAESGVNGSEAAKTEASSAKSEADAEAARNAAALEALAAFAPKQGEEQHETKGLLKKLKAKEQAEKAARRAEAEAKTGGTGEADAPVKSEAEPVKKSSLSSLLSSASDAPAGAETPAVVPSAVNKPAPVAKSAPREEAADDDDSSSGNSLGDAISNALDKLLGDDEAGSLSGAEPAKSVQAVEAVIEEKAESEAPASSKFLDDDPDRFNRPINSPRGAEKLLEDAVVASVSEPEAEVPAAESHPLTLTNSKVDALSRLLEVASKAPEKSGDDKNKPGDSANKLAQMINKPPGKISRQVETIDGPDYTQPKQEAFTSPFGGGTSPFASPGASYSGPGQKSPTATSPFGTPVNSSNSSVSLNHTPAGGFSPTGQSQSQQQIQSQAQSQGSFPGSGSMTDMPKASGIASDAVSARIAALNRKLEEQTRAPGASGSVSAMPSPGPSLAPPMDIMPPPMTAPPAMAPPAPDFVANPIVDGSPQTRAELVNRILGSAKISQTIPGEMPVRPPSDSTQGQLQAQKFQKNSPPKSKARAHGGRGGLDPKPFIIVFVVIAALCAGGYFAIQNGIINPKFVKGFDLGKGKSSETKLTIDQVIKSGDTAKAIEMLEAKKESGKFSSSEGEKLNGLYYSTAEKAYSNDDDPAEAMKLLEKIPPKTKKFKDAQKLLRKFKKKVKKN